MEPIKLPKEEEIRAINRQGEDAMVALVSSLKHPSCFLPYPTPAILFAIIR
jgi:hypothetical protein